jgi:hypothetical protein
LIQEHVNYLNISITSNQIEAIKSLPNKKSPGLEGVNAEFYQIVKNKLTPMFLKLFHETERGGTLLKLFHKASITFFPKMY